MVGIELRKSGLRSTNSVTSFVEKALTSGQARNGVLELWRILRSGSGHRPFEKANQTDEIGKFCSIDFKSDGERVIGRTPYRWSHLEI